MKNNIKVDVILLSKDQCTWSYRGARFTRRKQRRTAFNIQTLQASKLEIPDRHECHDDEKFIAFRQMCF